MHIHPRINAQRFVSCTVYQQDSRYPIPSFYLFIYFNLRGRERLSKKCILTVQLDSNANDKSIDENFSPNKRHIEMQYQMSARDRHQLILSSLGRLRVCSRRFVVRVVPRKD
jgi:hypothetical protein